MGLKIAFQYKIIKKPVLIIVGISWIGMASVYLPPAINFLLLITIGVPFNQIIYLSIYGTPPLTILCWLTAITNILNVENDKRTLILSITSIFCIIFMFLFYYFLFTDPTLIGTFVNPFIVNFTLFSKLYFLLFLGIFIMAGLMFIRESLKSTNPETLLKVKFLLAAFISFTIGVILTSFIPDILTKVIARIILVSSSIEFYMGFLLPKQIERHFLNL